MMYYPMYFDPTYILVLIGVVICLIASAKMNSTFSRYSRVRNHSGMTGRDAAALTYVAGAASAILQLLRILLLTGNRRND